MILQYYEYDTEENPVWKKGRAWLQNIKTFKLNCFTAMFGKAFYFTRLVRLATSACSPRKHEEKKAVNDWCRSRRLPDASRESDAIPPKPDEWRVENRALESNGRRRFGRVTRHCPLSQGWSSQQSARRGGKKSYMIVMTQDRVFMPHKSWPVIIF